MKKVFEKLIKKIKTIITDDGVRKVPFYRSIRFKLALSVAVAGILLLVFSLLLLTDSLEDLEHNLVNDRLAADIRYLRDELGQFASNWNKRDGALYMGDRLVGDGTVEHARTETFYRCEEVTGTFFYTFVKTDNDDELEYVESGGYMQGHYLRVAGTTKGPNGEDITGTYMDKKVADILESSEDGVYAGEANVNGRMIYCRYELLKDVRDNTVGAIVVGRSIEEMDGFISKERARTAILLVFMLVLMSVGLAIIITVMISSIKKITARLELIGTGEFPEDPLVVKSKDEIGKIAQSVNEMVESLRDKERIGAELDVATHIQYSMLPCIFPAFPDNSEFDIYATMHTAKEVGGDFYDFFMVDDTHLAIVMADVSGKGVPAALFMVIAKTLLKDHTQPGRDLGEIFTEVNQLLCESNSEGLFVTVFEGILDLETGEFRYANAGHEMPFICKKDGSFIAHKIKPGLVLAGMEDMVYKSDVFMLEPGDRLYQYTDGVTEATDANNQLYGMDRLEKALNANIDKSVTDLLPAIKEDIDEFVGDAPQFDDITMLCLEYKQKKEK